MSTGGGTCQSGYILPPTRLFHGLFTVTKRVCWCHGISEGFCITLHGASLRSHSPSHYHLFLNSHIKHNGVFSMMFHCNPPQIPTWQVQYIFVLFAWPHISGIPSKSFWFFFGLVDCCISLNLAYSGSVSTPFTDSTAFHTMNVCILQYCSCPQHLHWYCHFGWLLNWQSSCFPPCETVYLPTLLLPQFFSQSPFTSSARFPILIINCTSICLNALKSKLLFGGLLCFLFALI